MRLSGSGRSKCVTRGDNVNVEIETVQPMNDEATFR